LCNDLGGCAASFDPLLHGVANWISVKVDGLFLGLLGGDCGVVFFLLELLLGAESEESFLGILDGETEWSWDLQLLSLCLHTSDLLLNRAGSFTLTHGHIDRIVRIHWQILDNLFLS
jgi:hypothetical protein